MADIFFNSAKGKWAYLATLPAANDALIVVPLAANALGSDATLRDDATLAAVLTHATEQTTMGRKTLSSVTVTVDNVNDRVDGDAADVTWTAASGVPLGAVVICYDNDTTSGNDSNIVPLVKLDFAVAPNGGDITLQFATAGWGRAS